MNDIKKFTTEELEAELKRRQREPLKAQARLALQALRTLIYKNPNNAKLCTLWVTVHAALRDEFNTGSLMSRGCDDYWWEDGK